MTTIPDVSASVSQLSTAVSRAATDPTYRASLVQSGSSALTSAGIAIPAGLTVNTVENSDAVRHFVTFDKGEMSPEDQQQLASMLSGLSAPASDVEAWAKIVLDSWNDPSLRTRVESNAASVLAEYGFALPAGTSAKVVHASDSISYMVLPPSAAQATSASSVTIGEMAESITSSFTNLTKLITGASYVAGLAFSVGAIMKFKQHKDNPTQIPIGTPIGLLFIAAALLFLPTILSVAGYTMFGDSGQPSQP